MKFTSTLLTILITVGVPMHLRAFDLSDVSEFKVGSLPVVLRSTKEFGDIVAVQAVAFGGVALTDKPGLLALFSESLHKGTPSYSKEDIDKIFAETGAVFDISARSEAIEISLKCLKKYLPKLLPVVSEIVRLPLFQNEEIEITRKQMISGLKGEQEHPDGLLGLLAYKAFWQNHPYLNRPEGFLDSMESLTRMDLVELLPRVFNLSNMSFVAVGDLTQQELSEMILTNFGDLPEGTKTNPVETLPQNDTRTIHFQKFESPTTYFVATFKAPDLRSQDYPAMAMVSQILGDRLFEEVRTKRALTYSVSAGMGNRLLNSGSLYVSSTKIPEAVKVIFDEVKRIQNELIPSKDLEVQIRKFASTWYLGREQASQQARVYMLYEELGLGWRQSNTFIDRLKTVTPDQVREAARNYLKDFTVALVGPQEIDIRDLIPGFVIETPASAEPADPAKIMAPSPDAQKPNPSTAVPQSVEPSSPTAAPAPAPKKGSKKALEKKPTPPAQKSQTAAPGAAPAPAQKPAEAPKTTTQP